MAGERFMVRTRLRLEQPGMAPVVWEKFTACVNVRTYFADIDAAEEDLITLDSVVVASTTCPILILSSDVPGVIALPRNEASPTLPTDWTGARELNTVFVGQETSWAISNIYAIALKNPTARKARVTIRFGRPA